MKFLKIQQLEKLTTKRLLTYKNALMKVPEGPSWDGCNDRINKTTPEWIETVASIKNILSTRDHFIK